ncbi:unnamed protein product, partial [marine sediment metagenome]
SEIGKRIIRLAHIQEIAGSNPAPAIRCTPTHDILRVKHENNEDKPQTMGYDDPPKFVHTVPPHSLLYDVTFPETR